MRGKQNKQAGHSPHLSEVSVPSVLPVSFLLSEPLSRDLLTFQQTAFGKTSGKPNLSGSLRPVSKVSVGYPDRFPGGRTPVFVEEPLLSFGWVQQKPS